MGGEFTYRIQFPDAEAAGLPPHPGGLHPGAGPVRQHRGRALEPDWSPADRDVILTVDDLLVEEGKIAVQPHRDQLRRHGALRQRLLDQRGSRSHLEARREVVAVLTNTANTQDN